MNIGNKIIMALMHLSQEVVAWTKGFLVFIIQWINVNNVLELNIKGLFYQVQPSIVYSKS